MPNNRSSKGAGKRKSARKKSSKVIRVQVRARNHSNTNGSRGQKGLSLNNSRRIPRNSFESRNLGQDHVHIRGTEVISTLYTSAGFEVNQYKLLPTSTTLFPRLANIVRTYQKYRFTKLRWRYHPMCPATQVGSVAGCFQTDAVAPTQNIPSAIGGFANMPGGMIETVTQPASGFISFDREMPWFDLLSGSAAELSVWATLLIGLEGGSSTVALAGYLSLDYEIELRYMQQSSGLVFTNLEEGINSSAIDAYVQSTTNHMWVLCPGRAEKPCQIGNFLTADYHTFSQTTYTYGNAPTSPSYTFGVEGYYDSDTDNGYHVAVQMVCKRAATGVTLSNISVFSRYKDKVSGAWSSPNAMTKSLLSYVEYGGGIVGVQVSGTIKGSAQMYANNTELQIGFAFTTSGATEAFDYGTDGSNQLWYYCITRLDNSDPYGAVRRRRETRYDEKKDIAPSTLIADSYVPFSGPLRRDESDVHSGDWDDIKSDSGRSIPLVPGNRPFRDGDPRGPYRNADTARTTPR